MGRLQATEMANRTDLDTSLRWHLQGNHFPPIHTDFIEPAKKAIEIAREAELAYACGDEMECQDLYQTAIELPNGKVRTVAQIIEGMHLEPWIEINEEEEL